jgi:hypothetical protein
MNKGEVNYAERKALEQFDKWNDVTGVFTQGTGYYNEVVEWILDAVHIGIQRALDLKLNFDEDGNLIRHE